MTDTSIFRKQALQELSSPEQLDQLIQVVTPRAWIVANTVYIFLAFFILWSFFGSIPTQAESSGILLARGGDIYNAVAPAGSNRVERLLVKPGDVVNKGQPVVILLGPELNNQIQVAQTYLGLLQHKYARLSTEAAQKIAIHQKRTATQIAAEKRAIDNAQEKLQNLQELMAVRQQAFAKGIDTRQNVSQATEAYFNAKNAIESLNNQLLQLQITHDSFIDQWREQLRALEIKISDENRKLSDLTAQRDFSAHVLSPITGLVTHVNIAVGSTATSGASLVSIANQGKDLDALVYLPAKLGKQVKVGMRAQVTPTTVEKSEFGSIYGNVVQVAPFPATPEAILATLQNQDLVKKFTQQEPPIEVRIQLDADPKTVSRLKWSSSLGPEQIITPGTLATALITVREQPPITLLIPTLKKLVGVR